MSGTNARGGPWRIVHVVAPAPFGGLESVVRLLAAGQTRRGHDVTIVCSVDEPGHAFVEALRADGLRVHEIVVSGREYRRERREFDALVARARPHVVHSHGYRPDILHLGAARRAGAATVTTLHGFTGGNWRVGIYEWLQTRAARRAGAAIAVSQGIAMRLTRGSASNRVHLIRNAYAPLATLPTREEARALLGIPVEELSIGWIGRLSAEKGPDVAIDALARVQSHPTLHFVGAGPDEDALRSQARAAGVGDRVRFHGVVPEAGRIVRAFDVLLLSSRTEGTPMVVLEAMAAKTPIVATSVGGIPHILPEGAAVLAPSEDHGALAAALEQTLTGREAARARAGFAADVLRDEFGVEQWLDRHDEVYETLIR